MRTDKEMNLVAGPLRLKFADGELRYLTVGNKEVIRRVYFSQRDTRWDTTPSEFKRIDVQKKADSFRIVLNAVVRKDAMDFEWDAEIIGTSRGQITYKVHGMANSDFRFNRFGICVHYGAESLAGQQFELIDASGKSTPSEFPRLIRPSLWPDKFQTLKYTTADGMEVVTTLSPVTFGMEDQRNFGDSSFKAFSGMDYKYPRITKGTQDDETLTITVNGAKRRSVAARPLRIELGQPLETAKMPKIIPLDNTAKKGFFNDINKAREPFKGVEVVSWPYCTAVNLFDDDTQFENLYSIEDQAATARSFAPAAKLRMASVAFDPPYPRPSRDPRNQTMFSAAWAAAAMKHLAVVGVDEAMFDLAPGPGSSLLKNMADYAGARVLDTRVESVRRSPLEALAVQWKGATVIWVVNLTPRDAGDAALVLPGVTEVAVQLMDLNAKPDSARPEERIRLKRGILPLKLGGYGVCKVTIGAK